MAPPENVHELWMRRLRHLAEDIAAEHGEPQRARRIWTLARSLWQRLGNEEAAEEVAAKLDSGS